MEVNKRVSFTPLYTLFDPTIIHRASSKNSSEDLSIIGSVSSRAYHSISSNNICLVMISGSIDRMSRKEIMYQKASIMIVSPSFNERRSVVSVDPKEVVGR